MIDIPEEVSWEARDGIVFVQALPLQQTAHLHKMEAEQKLSFLPPPCEPVSLTGTDLSLEMVLSAQFFDLINV
jgi:hypothetical protein